MFGNLERITFPRITARKNKIKENWSETYGIREEKYKNCNRRNK